jgi:hypothetical protein
MFCQKLGKTYTETYNMTKMAFGEDSTSHTQVIEWFCHFQEAETLVEMTSIPEKLLKSACFVEK